MHFQNPTIKWKFVIPAFSDFRQSRDKRLSMATFLAPEIKSWRYLLKTFYSQICSLRRYFIVHEAGVESYNVDRPDIDGSSAINRRCICLPNISEADIR
ncbi:hypothetical protein AVEN_91771-1 [Araneus ventricosus]|uniref:Uncharacterized protein n=1 Tax=Araneus ventricosus TaxID=182803 RepID=A0A4Y2TI00_ARAVE|nr:hypothetical protein AVEN_91771-1 [Araneus ventricosus]